jgi:hypothetical protein
MRPHTTVYASGLASLGHLNLYNNCTQLIDNVIGAQGFGAAVNPYLSVRMDSSWLQVPVFLRALLVYGGLDSLEKEEMDRAAGD